MNRVTTQYYYGGGGSSFSQADQDPYDTGDLIAVVQDPGGAGHLNRTTVVTYDAAGRVLTSIDPLGQTSTLGYNSLGQPLMVGHASASSAPATLRLERLLTVVKREQR